VAALSALMLLSGCMEPDVAVIDISTSQVVHATCVSWRQMVISVDSSNQVFRTMVRKDDHLIIRTLDRNCEEQNEVAIPLFTEGYCSTQGRAISPEGDRIVYFQVGTHNLCLYNLSARHETQIWTNIARYAMFVPKVEWLSDTELLIVRREDGLESTNEIVVLDLLHVARSRLISPADLSSFAYALSPDRRLFAYWEG
jgi:hypothetical protein